MSDEHCVSRRASLKSLGAVGAAIVLGGGAAASQQVGTKPQAETKPQVEPKPAKSDPEKPAGSVVDVAATRMTKGHS